MEYSVGGCIHELFEEQVKKSPQVIAVEIDGESLSYIELNTRANRLARCLVDNGVTPDSFVGICMPRSLELMVSLMAILKAGGSYVPIDPELPQRRIQYIMELAQLSNVITTVSLKPSLDSFSTNLICIDDTAQMENYSQFNRDLSLKIDGANLAYAIFTSGSTGQPKGVMNSHNAVRNRLIWMQKEYQFTDKDRVLQKTPITFDVSVWELFLPLMTGASLIFARPDGHKDPEYLKSLIADKQITTLHFVPSMLESFLDASEAISKEDASFDFKCLRQVFCSGEELTVGSTQRFFSEYPEVALHNLYGPTEAAIDVSYWHCQPDSKDSRIPIGHPIANTQLYVLDQGLQLVPLGVVGELYIGGVNLARGYLARADLTADRFIPNPWSQQAESDCIEPVI